MGKIIDNILKALFALVFIATSLVAKAQIRYLETPVLYEDKHSTSFKVFQTLDGKALASEISNKQYGWYNGNTVLLLGDMFYDGQIVKMRAPMQVGVYRYESKGNGMKTVPVVQQLLTNEVKETTEVKKESKRERKSRIRSRKVQEEE